MITVSWLEGPAPYQAVWNDMRVFTAGRTPDTPDAIWLVEHEPVYTLGQAGKPDHVLNPGHIPLVRSDRGGQVTYHGPGQVVAYCLVDLRRYGLFVKEYVALLEDAVIAVLNGLGLEQACRKDGAPGVYVPGRHGLAKISALGIKIRNGCAYHGIALNVNMDLTPFSGINPCGYEGLETTDLEHCGVHVSVVQAGELLARHVQHALQQRLSRGKSCYT
ncbi:MAG: lipoyl(octanoyl) transferase LipB [Alcaligenaceae bacterium]|nr:lipoyl(octanoyl) transferase LipB [Alcaligenaceae bacterium]